VELERALRMQGRNEEACDDQAHPGRSLWISMRAGRVLAQIIFFGGSRASGTLESIAFEYRHRLDMRCTCLYAGNMSKMVQIRDVPDKIHSTLKSRAAREGMSLSDFIKRELERSVQRPTMEEWLERTQQAKAMPVSRSAAQVIRELREAR
jgi:plasmid stability protein